MWCLQGNWNWNWNRKCKPMHNSNNKHVVLYNGRLHIKTDIHIYTCTHTRIQHSKYIFLLNFMHMIYQLSVDVILSSLSISRFVCDFDVGVVGKKSKSEVKSICLSITCSMRAPNNTFYFTMNWHTDISRGIVDDWLIS